MNASLDPIQIQALSPTIGAEISGVDLTADLSKTTVATIRQALLDHLVIFFRDQQLTPESLLAFAGRFGELSRYPFVAGMEDYPDIVEVIKNEQETVNFGGLWHTDTSYLERPPMGSILYAREVPEVGGDTLFANMYLAYDALSEGMQKLLRGLHGVNSAEKPAAAVGRAARIADKPLPGQSPETELATCAAHPLLRTHPETGRYALYCSNAHTTHIEGLSLTESQLILPYLYQLQQREAFSCRFRWRPGSVAFWDNRCTQHNALNDYHGSRRVMWRVTLAGEQPC